MLAREQGGGSNHRDLLAGACGNECGAQRDFGLAKPYIAANKATLKRINLGEGTYLLISSVLIPY